MKIRRHKKAHRILSFYTNNFGFRAPYQLVLDGTFCQALLKQRVQMKDQVPKYLGDQVKYFSTACVLNEVESLGPAFYGAVTIIKQFSLRSCGHEKNPISAVKCLHSLVCKEQDNEHYLIATQDDILIRKLRQFVNCPVLTLHRSCLTILKPPTIASLAAEQKSEEALIEDSEVKELKELKKIQLGSDLKTKKKKRGPKQPNPLSCKRKKRGLPMTSLEKKMESTTDQPKKKRQRRRSKIPLPVDRVLQTHLADSTESSSQLQR